MDAGGGNAAPPGHDTGGTGAATPQADPRGTASTEDHDGRQDARGQDPGSGDDDALGGSAATTLIASLVSLAESLSEYVASLLRLEGHRLEGEARGFIRRLGGFLVAIAVIVFGILFVCVAAAVWLSDLLDSPAAGYGIIGAACIVAGAIVVFATGRLRAPAEPAEEEE